MALVVRYVRVRRFGVSHGFRPSTVANSVPDNNHHDTNTKMEDDKLSNRAIGCAAEVLWYPLGTGLTALALIASPRPCVD